MAQKYCKFAPHSQTILESSRTSIKQFKGNLKYLLNILVGQYKACCMSIGTETHTVQAKLVPPKRGTG